MATNHITDITPPPSPILMDPPVIQRILEDSGAFDDTSLEEYERNPPICSYHHSDFGCDHDDQPHEGGFGGPIYRGHLYSPLTVPTIAMPLDLPGQIVMDYVDDDAWTRDIERLVAESKAIREAPLSAFADLAALDDDDTIPEVDIDFA